MEPIPDMTNVAKDLLKINAFLIKAAYIGDKGELAWRPTSGGCAESRKL